MGIRYFAHAYIEGELPHPRSPANGTEPCLANPCKRFHGRVSGPRACPYRMGHGHPLEPPDNISTRNLQFATRSMGVAETSPSVPRRDGEGAYKLVREPILIASNGPRLGGSTHGYTSWGAPNADDAEYVRVAPPRPAEISPMPAETNTPHAGRSCEKTLQERPRSCKASGARPAGPLARPHGITPATRGEESPISKRQHLRDPTDTPADARGILSGTAIRVP
jgi:hypothetical protein